MDFINYPDGGKVELRQSGNGNSPDNQGGQHTNRSTLWARENDGPWLRVECSRSIHRAWLAAKACKTASEAMKQLQCAH